jgi:hypothetical protein
MVRNLSAVSIADSTMQPLVRRTIQRALPEWCDDLRAWQRPAAARAGTEVRSLTQWNAPFRLIGLPVLPQSAHERNPSLQRRERARRPVPSGSATTCPRPGGPATRHCAHTRSCRRQSSAITTRRLRNGPGQHILAKPAKKMPWEVQKDARPALVGRVLFVVPRDRFELSTP